MDEVIASYRHVPFEELEFCPREGVMYQRDMSFSVNYGREYMDNYVRLENTTIAKRLNEGRTCITEKYASRLLDIGIGSGEFIKSSKIDVLGYDINPHGVEWLKERNIFADPYASMPDVEGLTFWDSLEHIPCPSRLLSLVPQGVFVFFSLPIFTDLTRLKQSKHYKTNEHYYYFTTNGMIQYMNDSGFELKEISDFESRSGREDILTFVFLRH
jgi:hypothetical protein